MIRYVCYGGFVGARYVSAATVRRLYGIKQSECFTIDTNIEGVGMPKQIRGLKRYNFVILKPDPLGKYHLKEEMERQIIEFQRTLKEVK